MSTTELKRVPIVPMNCTLIPVCSSLLPSLGLIVTAPLTDSPSMYNGAFSRRFLSNLRSTIAFSSLSSRTMSMSTGVEKKYDMMTNGTYFKRVRLLCSSCSYI